MPKTTGFGPSARYGHSLTLTADGRLFIIGGVSAVKDTGGIIWFYLFNNVIELKVSDLTDDFLILR
jgi:hypothetical protein